MQILRYPDKRLELPSAQVTEADLPEIRELLPQMTELMKKANGVGLAAVQVGIHKRFALLDLSKDPYYDPKTGGEPILVVINPVILEATNETRMTEGCLSLPFLEEVVDRYSSIKIEYLDENWVKHVRSFEGILAQCLQHEVEHFDGILLTRDLSHMRLQMYRKKLQKRGLL
jgi:peptide deformylase